MTDVTIALLGCGKQAPKHLSGYREVDGVEILVADSDPRRREHLAEEEALRAIGVDRAFDDPEIDAVDICTPTPTHRDLVLRAIESGKDFMCEKPLTPDLAAAKEIEDALTGNGVIGMVGYLYRYVPGFEAAKELLEPASESGRSEVLGSIVTAHFRIGGRGSHRQWKHRSASGGGAVREMMVHMLDLAVWFFGDVVEVDLLAKELLRPTRRIEGEARRVDAEDYVLTRLEMEGGVSVLCQADLVTPAFTQYIEIQGDNGTFMGSIQQEIPSFVYCSREIDGWTKGKNSIDEGPVNLFALQAAEFVQAIRTRERPERNTIEDSVRLMEAVEMIEGETA